MIVDVLENALSYHASDTDLAKGFGFVGRALREDLPDGRYPIDGDRVVGLVQSYSTDSFREENWETHDHHLDLHVVTAGEESIHWTPPTRLVPIGDCDPADDTRMLRGEAGAALRLSAGWFAVFRAGEPHQPRCHADGPGEVRKIVVKILE